MLPSLTFYLMRVDNGTYLGLNREDLAPRPGQPLS
jgi:hypothetical protein